MLLVEWEQVVDPGDQSARHRARRASAGAAWPPRARHRAGVLLRRRSFRSAADRPRRARTGDRGRGAAWSRDDEQSADPAVMEIAGSLRRGRRAGPRERGRVGGCTPDEVIERHAMRTYRVYMLGFVPGFAYMGRVDQPIAAPRRRVPRERVPAGSVGHCRRADRCLSDRHAGRVAAYRADRRGDVRRDAPAAQPAAARAISFVSCRSRWADDRRDPRRSARAADDGAGPRALGLSGVGRAGRRADGHLLASSGQSARRQSGQTPPRSEITLIGPELEFDAPATIAVCGAEFDVTANGQPCPWRRPCASPAGRALQFGRRRCRRARLSGRCRRRADAAGARKPRDAPGERDGRRRRAARSAAGDRLPVSATAIAWRRPPRVRTDVARQRAGAAAGAARARKPNGSMPQRDRR